MRNDDVLPYLTPPPGSVKASGWVRIEGESADSVDDYIPDWDQNTELRFKSVITADLTAITRETGISVADLSWAVGWYVPETGLVGPSQSIAATEGETELDLLIPPRFTGNSIRLTRRLVLAHQRDNEESPLIARIAGSILWSDSTTIRLAGTGASFPTEIVDFAKVPTLHRLARNSWYLELPDSVEQPVMGGLLLMINSADQALAAAVSAPAPDELQRLLVQSLQEAVTDHLVRWALTHWDELKDLDDSSVGAVARVLTERILPDPEQWTLAESDAMELHARIIDGARRIGLGRAIA